MHFKTEEYKQLVPKNSGSVSEKKETTILSPLNQDPLGSPNFNP